MFLGNDTVTVLAGGEEVTVNGCLVQIHTGSGRIPGGRALIPHQLEPWDTIRYAGTEYTVQDGVMSWRDAGGSFDHSEVVLEEVAAGGGRPD